MEKEASKETQGQPSTSTQPEKTLNVYPLFRHLFLIFCILLTAAIVFILIYQNGKSIYENGL